MGFACSFAHSESELRPIVTQKAKKRPGGGQQVPALNQPVPPVPALSQPVQPVSNLPFQSKEHAYLDLDQHIDNHVKYRNGQQLKDQQYLDLDLEQHMDAFSRQTSLELQMDDFSRQATCPPQMMAIPYVWPSKDQVYMSAISEHIDTFNRQTSSTSCPGLMFSGPMAQETGTQPARNRGLLSFEETPSPSEADSHLQDASNYVNIKLAEQLSHLGSNAAEVPKTNERTNAYGYHDSTSGCDPYSSSLYLDTPTPSEAGDAAMTRMVDELCTTYWDGTTLQGAMPIEGERMQGQCAGFVSEEGDRMRHVGTGYVLSVNHTFIQIDDDSSKNGARRRSSSTSGLRHCGL